jgi:FKBP-type peptidyl-prolyl cis-trans isomerase SlpA
MKKVQNGDTVVVNYTGRLEDGTVFDSSLNEGREPLKAQLGQGLLIKGFEDGLLEMIEGDKKTIEIESKDAYGDVNAEMIAEVPKEQMPEGVSVGDMLQANGPSGAINVIVSEVKENTVVVDANHPLAGKKLIFDLELISID